MRWRRWGMRVRMTKRREHDTAKNRKKFILQTIRSSRACGLDFSKCWGERESVRETREEL